MSLTEVQIKKLPRKNVSINQFINISSRFEDIDLKALRKQVNKLENGTFLGVHQNKNGRMYRLHLKTIWIKTFNVLYSVKAGPRYEGKEMIISSMPLPPGPVV